MKRDIKDQVNDIIRDEIQEVINQYVDDSGKGFDGEELKVNIPQDEVDKLLKEYKKIKRRKKSNLSEVKKMGLVDKNGRPLDG